MFHEAENAVKAGLNDAEFRNVLQEKGLLVEHNPEITNKLEQTANTREFVTQAAYTILVFSAAMDQLCFSLGCRLYHQEAADEEEEEEEEEEVYRSAALLGSGNGGRVYKVIMTDSDGKESIKALKIVGVKENKELYIKTKNEFNYILWAKATCPDHVLGVCGMAITEGKVKSMSASNGRNSCTYEHYLGYLMPTVAESIKGSMPADDIYVILLSLYTLHCSEIFHGSARLDNVLYNTEQGLYQWIDFRDNDLDFQVAIAKDMESFFRSMAGISIVRENQKSYDRMRFNSYAEMVVLGKLKGAWLELENIVQSVLPCKEKKT